MPLTYIEEENELKEMGIFCSIVNATFLLFNDNIFYGKMSNMHDEKAIE